MPDKLPSLEAERHARELKIRQCDDQYDGTTLFRTLFRKVRRRLWGDSSLGISAAAEYHGTIVFDRPDLDGGGRDFGQDIHRILREIRPEGCERLFEFCAGPGYMGYSLLASGYCQYLVLGEINPVAIAAAQKTAQYNGLWDKVRIYQADGLTGIDEGERWDAVISNPPHLPVVEGNRALRLHDEGWKLHRAFYARIKRFLNPGAVVVMQENRRGSSEADFVGMIEGGGGKLLRVMDGPLPQSEADVDRIYYLVCTYE